MPNRPYFTLLVREGRSAPWGVHFGSYHNDDAVQEQESVVYDNDYSPTNTKIIQTAAAQSAIDAKVAELNAKGVAK